MKNLLICHYDENKNIQNIFMIKDEQPYRFPFDNEILGQAIGEFVMAQQIYEVDLYGNEDFTEPLKEAILNRIDDGSECLINLKPEKIKPDIEPKSREYIEPNYEIMSEEDFYEEN